MSWDYAVVLPWRALDLERLRATAAEVIQHLPGVTMTEGPESNGRVPFFFHLPRKALLGEDLRDVEEVERDQGIPPDDPLPSEIEARVGGAVCRTDIGQCVLRIRSNRSGNRYVWTTISHILDEISQRLGGVPDEPRLPLAELRRSIEETGDASAEWKAFYAPDGDLDAGIARIWAEEPFMALEPFLEALEPRKLIAFGIRACKAVHDPVDLGDEVTAKALRAVEWWHEGKALLPAVARTAAALDEGLEQVRRSGDSLDDYPSYTVLLLAQAALCLEQNPDEARQRIRSILNKATSTEYPKLAELVRKAMKPPKLAALKKRLFRPPAG